MGILNIKISSSPYLWSAIDVLSRQVVQAITAIIIARLISPEDFGKISFIGAVVTLIATFVDGGFSTYLVKSESIDQELVETVFWMKFVLAIIFFILVLINFYGEYFVLTTPLLNKLIVLYSAVFVVSSTNGVHIALADRDLDFKIQSRISVASSVLSSITAIIMALNGFGLWALVAQAIVMQIVTTYLYWRLVSWRPKLSFSFNYMKKILDYSSYVFGSNLVENLSINISSLVIGYHYPFSSLGFYNRADAVSLLPTTFFNKAISRVCFSDFSKISENVEFLKQKSISNLKLINMIVLPSYLGIALVANPLINLLYGVGWESSTVVLQLLSLSYLGLGYQIINTSILMSVGQTNDVFRLLMAKKLVLIALTVAAGYLNFIYIPWAVLLSGIFGFGLDFLSIKRQFNLSFLEQLSSSKNIYLSCGLMVGVVYIISHMVDLQNAIKLVLLIVSGVFIYCASCFLMEREEVLRFYSLVRLSRKTNS